MENVPLEGIERFQQQLEIVDLIDTEDMRVIQSKKINECVEKDQDALEAEPLVMEVEEVKKKLKIANKKRRKKLNLRHKKIMPRFINIYFS